VDFGSHAMPFDTFFGTYGEELARAGDLDHDLAPVKVKSAPGVGTRINPEALWKGKCIPLPIHESWFGYQVQRRRQAAP
jgi:hypothetical protein